MFSQEVPCRSSASNASCFRFASALGIHDEYSDVLFSLLTLFTMCCLWFATTLPFACQRMRALLSSFVNCRQGVWKWNGSGFCFSESTSSMPARDWQCRGQSFLLLVHSKDNVLCKALCAPTAAEQIITMTTMMTMMTPVVRNYVAFRLPVDACFTLIFREL